MQDLIFDADILEEISAEKTRKKKTELMLRKLTKRGPKAYDSFRNALYANDVYRHFVDKLDNTVCEETLTCTTKTSENMPDSVEPLSQPGPLAEGGVTPHTPNTPTTPSTPSTPSTPALPVVRTQFTDLECLELADLLGLDKDFRRLGLCLGFKDPALRRYSRENSVGSCLGIYKMLIDWKKEFSVHEQRERLSDALDNAGLKNLAFQVRHGMKCE